MKEKKDFLDACSLAKENAVGSNPTPTHYLWTPRCFGPTNHSLAGKEEFEADDSQTEIQNDKKVFSDIAVVHANVAP